MISSSSSPIKSHSAATSSSAPTGTSTTASSSTSRARYIPPHLRPNYSPSRDATPPSMEDRISKDRIDGPLLTYRIRNSKQILDLVRIFKDYSDQFNTIHINCFVSSLAKRKAALKKIESIYDDLQKLIMENRTNFSPRELCNLSWSIGNIVHDTTPLSQIFTEAFSNDSLWTRISKLKEFAMLLNGLAEMKISDQLLASRIIEHVNQNPTLLTDESTSLGALSLFAKGLSSHYRIPKPLQKSIIEAFCLKGGLKHATTKEIIILLKNLVANDYFDKDFFDEVIANLFESRLSHDTASLWYLTSLGRIFADIRYDHPLLLESLNRIVDIQNIERLHNFDLPNLAMILAEISPHCFSNIMRIITDMKRRWEQQSYPHYGVDNFLQACWALACTKSTVAEERLFLEVVQFILPIIEKNTEKLHGTDKSQLYQIAILADLHEITKSLETETNIFISDVTITDTHYAIAMELQNKGYEVTIEKKVRGFSFDICLENVIIDGKPVIIEVDGSYHYTKSGKETGRTLLQSQIIRKLGYHLIRVNLMNDQPVIWHVEWLCDQLPPPTRQPDHE